MQLQLGSGCYLYMSYGASLGDWQMLGKSEGIWWTGREWQDLESFIINVEVWGREEFGTTWYNLWWTHHKLYKHHNHHKIIVFWSICIWDKGVCEVCWWVQTKSCLTDMIYLRKLSFLFFPLVLNYLLANQLDLWWCFHVL